MSIHDDEREERMVAQLLGGVPPTLEMPEREKRRALEALRAEAARQRREIGRPSRHRSWRVAALAAAAVLVIGMLALLWPSGGSGGIAWADVAQHLVAAQSMNGPWSRTLTAPDGTVREATGRLYYRDPGLYRRELDSETVTAPDGGTTRTETPGAVLIVRQLREDIVSLEINPQRGEAIRTELDLTGSMLGPWREFHVNPAAMAWFKLRELSDDETRVIGRRTVAGESAIGFAAPLAIVMGPQPLEAEPEGEVRVWASSETAVPIAVEIETILGGGWSKTDAVEPITWNAELPDSLFDDSSAEGLELRERKAHTRGFPAPELKPEVTIRIGPETGGAVVNELDVVGAVAGTILFEPWKRWRYHTIITFELTEEAADRLRSFLVENPGTRLMVDFNGEFHRPWFHPRVASRFIEVEMYPLRLRLIDFEIGYLEHGEETARAAVERARAMSSRPSPQPE